MFFEALFTPSEEGLYSQEALKHANTKIALTKGGQLRDGPFKGQQCFYVPNSTVGGIPLCDLKELKSVPSVKWSDLLKKMGTATPDRP